MYKLESHLVKDLESHLTRAESPFTQLNIAFEFGYNSGRTDVIGLTEDGHLIAFEAKLTRWREAVHQAYRSTSFAHYSYVVLPKSVVENALRQRHEFERRGIGLCSIDPSVDSSVINIEIPATKKEPLLRWLTNSALKYIGVRGETCHSNPLCCQLLKSSVITEP
jgi:hypothetical protein